MKKQSWNILCRFGFKTDVFQILVLRQKQNSIKSNQIESESFLRWETTSKNLNKTNFNLTWNMFYSTQNDRVYRVTTCWSLINNRTWFNNISVYNNTHGNIRILKNQHQHWLINDHVTLKLWRQETSLNKELINLLISFVNSLVGGYSPSWWVFRFDYWSVIREIYWTSLIMLISLKRDFIKSSVCHWRHVSPEDWGL